MSLEKNSQFKLVEFLIIKIDNNYKSAFDFLMLFISIYNIFSNAYLSAFGLINSYWFVILDNFVESLYLLDLIFCFLQEYQDEETYTIVRDLKKIAINYLKRSFILDLIAWVPFNYFYSNRLLRLLKLFRIRRLFQLFNVENFKHIVSKYYSKQLQQNVKDNNNKDGYPIMKTIMIVQIYKITQLVIVIFACSYFLGVFWYIYC